MAHKLLLADDSVTIQRVIELTFADEDVDVITVGDGQLAIECLETDPPDIVLADVDMPRRDGYEVAAYVKSRPKLAHIPVVLLTGAFEPIDQVRASAAGSSDVLAKPFEPQRVINRVKELLGKKRQNEEESYDALPRQTTAAPPAEQPMAQVAKPAPANGQATGDGGSLSLDDYFDQLDAAFSNLQPGSQTADAAHQEIDWAAAIAPVPPPYVPLERSETLPTPVAPAASVAPVIAPFPETPAAKPHVPDHVAAPAPEPVAAVAHAPEPIVPPPSVAAVALDDATASNVPVTASLTPIAPIAPVVSAFATPDTSVASAFALDASAFAPSTSVDKTAPKPVAPAPPIALAAPAPAEAVASESAPKPVTQRITTNPFATLSAAKAEAAARSVAPVITDEVIEEVVSRVLQRLSDKVVRETVSEIVSQTAERLVQEEIERIKNSGAGD
jgi:CheY-like chemotaxis protein